MAVLQSHRMTSSHPMTTKPVQPEKQRMPAASHLYRKKQPNEHSTLVAPFHAIRFSINMPTCRIGEISSKVRMQILPHRKPKKRSHHYLVTPTFSFSHPEFSNFQIKSWQ
jgi:hypothetical protein